MEAAHENPALRRMDAALARVRRLAVVSTFAWNARSTRQNQMIVDLAGRTEGVVFIKRG